MQPCPYHFRIRLAAVAIRLVVALGLLLMGNVLSRNGEMKAEIRELASVHH